MSEMTTEFEAPEAPEGYPQQQLLFSDAVHDPPSFRWRLKRLEKQVDEQSSHLEKVLLLISATFVSQDPHYLFKGIQGLRLYG